MAKARGEFPPIPRNKTAKVKTKDGGGYEFHYADLADIMEAIKEILAKNELFVTHPVVIRGDKLFLKTEIRHSSGETLESTIPIAAPAGRPQDFGSQMTYLRRYALSALLGIASEEDDDGNAAQGNQAQTGQRNKAAAKAAGGPKPQGQRGPNPAAHGPSDAQLKRLFAMAKANTWNDNELKDAIDKLFQKSSTKTLIAAEYEQLCRVVQEYQYDAFVMAYREGAFGENVEAPADPWA